MFESPTSKVVGIVAGVFGLSILVGGTVSLADTPQAGVNVTTTGWRGIGLGVGTTKTGFSDGFVGGYNEGANLHADSPEAAQHRADAKRAKMLRANCPDPAYAKQHATACLPYKNT